MSRSYHSYLIDSLQDPQEAAAYLEAVLEDCSYDELCLALRNVTEARLAASQTAQANLNQEFCRSILASSDRLEPAILFKVLNELGFKLSVTPLSDAA
jgi:DNA-binding phage protein